MKLHLKLAQYFMLASMTFATPVFAKDGSLFNLLDSFGSGWTQTTFEQMATADWNVAGSLLNFNLAYENPSQSPWQTFSIYESLPVQLLHGESEQHEDGGAYTNAMIFKAADVIGATKSYTLSGSFMNALFGSNKIGDGNEDAKVYVDSTGGKFAFVRENESENGKFKGMLVEMSVTPVPEPGVWQMIISGIAVLGLLGYRRKQSI